MFCGKLNEGRPASSKTTISPSTTIPGGSSRNAATISGNCRLRTFFWREYSVTSESALTATARYPSNLTSYAHCSPSGNLETDRHSIGFINAALHWVRESKSMAHLRIRLVVGRTDARRGRYAKQLRLSLLWRKQASHVNRSWVADVVLRSYCCGLYAVVALLPNDFQSWRLSPLRSPLAP